MSVTLYRISGGDIQEQEFANVTNYFAIKSNGARESRWGWHNSRESAIEGHRETLAASAVEAERLFLLRKQQLELFNAKHPKAEAGQ